MPLYIIFYAWKALLELQYEVVLSFYLALDISEHLRRYLLHSRHKRHLYEFKGSVFFPEESHISSTGRSPMGVRSGEHGGQTTQTPTQRSTVQELCETLFPLKLAMPIPLQNDIIFRKTLA